MTASFHIIPYLATLLCNKRIKELCGIHTPICRSALYRTKFGTDLGEDWAHQQVTARLHNVEQLSQDTAWDLDAY